MSMLKREVFTEIAVSSGCCNVMFWPTNFQTAHAYKYAYNLSRKSFRKYFENFFLLLFPTHTVGSFHFMFCILIFFVFFRFFQSLFFLEREQERYSICGRRKRKEIHDSFVEFSILAKNRLEL